MTRTYVITGAGSGIGKATADLLRVQGQNVIGVDLRGDDAWSWADERVGEFFANLGGGQ